MKAVDTNILVYAYHGRHPYHGESLRILKDLSGSMIPWALPWPCVYEFLRVMSHPRVSETPLSAREAWRRIEDLLSCPSLMLLSETDRHSVILGALLEKIPLSADLVYDARIAALLIEHGVREIVTADEDFRRFQELTVINPFRG